MFSDEAKYGIAREERGVEVERTLGDVSVGEGNVDAVPTKIAAKGSEGHPMIQISGMNRKILKELTNHGATIRRISTSKKL